MIQPTNTPGKEDILKQADDALELEFQRRTAALRESETRYRTMIDASPVSIMAIRDGCFHLVNPAGCRMLGYSKQDELIGMSAMNIVAPESRALIAERMKRLENGEDNPRVEAVLSMKDGTHITVETSSVSVPIDDKNTAIVFSHDIGKRKEAEIKLKDSEAQLNGFLNHYPANIYIKGCNSRHVYANEQLLKYLGISSKSFHGTTSHDFFPADVANRMEQHDRALLTEKLIDAREIERVGKDGKPRWYSDLKFPIQLASGETLIGGISSDITERKRAEKKIEELRCFEQLLAEISTSFIDVPIEKIDQYINDALERIGRLLGFDRCSLGNVTPDHKAMIVTHVWNRGSVSGVQQSYALEQYPWLLSPFTTGNALLWNNSMALPDGSEADIRLLEESGMQSFAGIPVTVAGELKACLGFSTVSDQKHWEPELFNRLNHLSRIFGNVLARKQADKDLMMMQYSVDHSLDRIAWIAPDGKFLYANRAACQEMHYTQEQVLAMGVPDVNPDFPQDKWNEHFHRLKEVGSMRLEVQQVDGRGKVHHIDVASTYNNFGGSEFICSFARDITQLRQAERNLKEQLAFEDLIARLSATFIHIKASEIDRTIEAGLGLVTDFLDIQRSNLFQFSKNMHELQLTHAFVVEGVGSAPETLYKEEHPWFVNRLLSGEPYSFSSPDELPQEAGAERTYLKKAGIKSAAILPLMAAGVSHGGITLSAMDASRQWSDKLIHQMTILAEVFSSALLRKRAHDIIETRLNIESLLTNLATGFINLDVGETDNYLEGAMGEIAELFNVDRSSILQFDADMSELLRTHIWERDGINPDPHGVPIRVHEQFPKLFTRLKNAETVSVLEAATSPDDEVAAYCQSIGIQSFIMLPLIVGKRNLGYLVVSTIFTKMALTDDQLRHFRLFSTVVANALARQQTALALEESQLQTRMLAGRMLSIQENERKRLARELHDDLSQRLAVLAMSCSRMRTDLAPLSPESTDSINSMHRQLVKISEDVHAISRQLHPSILEDLGLVDAVRNEINAFRQREGLHVDYLPSGIPERLPKGVSLCFFRIIQEGLRNIAKHAQAESASIALTGSAEQVALEISDNGCGFDQESDRAQLGLGLISIGERVRMINGTFEVTSSPGQGTRIQVSAPIAAEARPKIT